MKCQNVEKLEPILLRKQANFYVDTALNPLTLMRVVVKEIFESIL